MYFKQLYPAAKIVAVEADPQIFALLEQNVTQRRLTDVTLINKAIAVETERVTFHREGADAGRIHALADAIEQITVPTLSLDELLMEPVDLLKVDVEGVETDVLCASRRLDAVSQIMVEYHAFADVSQSLHQLLTKLAESGFRYNVQTQFCPPRPLVDDSCHLGMDLQLTFSPNAPPAMQPCARRECRWLCQCSSTSRPFAWGYFHTHAPNPSLSRPKSLPFPRIPAIQATWIPPSPLPSSPP